MPFFGGFFVRWIARIRGSIKANSYLDTTMYVFTWSLAALVLLEDNRARLGVAVLVVGMLLRAGSKMVFVGMPDEAQVDTISRAYHLIDLGMSMAESVSQSEARLIRAFINATPEERLAFLETIEQTSGVTARDHQH